MTRNSFPNDEVKLNVNNFGYLEKCVNQNNKAYRLIV